nr:unnamed protein product [Digitaria exilis]
MGHGERRPLPLILLCGAVVGAARRRGGRSGAAAWRQERAAVRARAQRPAGRRAWPPVKGQDGTARVEGKAKRLRKRVPAASASRPMPGGGPGLLLPSWPMEHMAVDLISCHACTAQVTGQTCISDGRF